MRVAGRELPAASIVGLSATVLLTLSSFGGGAVRQRGGLLEKLGAGFLTYGHGAVFSNVGMAAGLVVLPMAWVLLGAEAFRALRTGSPVEVVNRAMIRTIALWIAPLILAAPMLSRDVYSYLIQGKLMAEGLDPYTVGAAAAPGPILLEVSPDWRNTTTPYGPVHLWLAEGVVGITGDSITAGCLLLKLISIAGYIAIVASVVGIAGRLGGNTVLALWLGPANPVMLLHLVAGMHNESVMVGLVGIAVWLALCRRFIPAALVIGLAVAMKATAVIALPFMVWMYGARLTKSAAARGIRKAQQRRDQELADCGVASDNSHEPARAIKQRYKRRKKVLKKRQAGHRTSLPGFLAAGAVMTVTAALPLTLCAWASGAGWGWLGQLSGNTKVVNPLSLPTAAASVVTPVVQMAGFTVDFNDVVAVTRRIGVVLLLVGLMWCWWYFRRGLLANTRGITAAYLVAVTLNAVALPWYYASILALVGTVRPGPKTRWWTVFFSLVVAVSFSGSGNHQLYNPVWMVPTLLAAWVLTDWVTPVIDAGLTGPDEPAAAHPAAAGDASPTLPA
ncbi:alpha-(1-_6)-mannopyranosyltransferase A [Corynebacterium mendelii]|uniref:Alpha-(1->6)-mannopyranosyltransferase A n=1 Tax=Corynebacterium mendelii TaxID=2765362 RepID=A0A939IWX9_9CORY|nr:alpha-(1->6)-mannopyranosyltransferase A [Corynebacterium mendelii]MBN9643087.1 alpha-(1->6)-mannopyranosyltransferase A [Corynebacterium mendelii]